MSGQSYGMVHTCAECISLACNPRLDQTAHHVAWKSMTESLLFSFDKIPLSCESEVMCVIDMASKNICTKHGKNLRQAGNRQRLQLRAADAGVANAERPAKP